MSGLFQALDTEFKIARDSALRRFSMVNTKDSASSKHISAYLALARLKDSCLDQGKT